MSTPLPDSRALLTAFMLAAGCGEPTYEDFLLDRDAMQADLDELCAGTLAPSPVPRLVSTEDGSLGDCRWFRPRRGDDCLDALDEVLTEVEDDVAACTSLSDEAPLSACETDRVTRRRRGVRCFFERITSGGRPIRVDGAPLLAPLLGFEASGEGRRAQAARRWAANARFEHASIAAFGRVAIDLMSLGAPVSLVRRCHEAALDEARHADATLAIAARLCGRPLSFGLFPARTFAPRSLHDVAIDALVEGCCAEGTAAVVAQVGASRATPAIAATLGTIATEETQHAQLAWATLRWAVERRPELIAVLERRLAAMEDVDEPTADDDEADLSECGLLGAAETAALARAVRRQLVAPTLRALGRRIAADGAAARA